MRRILRFRRPYLVAAACLLCVVALAGTGGPPDGAGVDVCAEDFVLPDDCVAQMGAIGGAPVHEANEGFLDIVAPLVDPLLLLDATGPEDGLLYVLNPLANQVRVLDPASEMAVVGDIPVCYRPSALAQNEDGSEVLVSCHASHAVGVIDTASRRMVAEIQDRDAEGLPRLQEPMAIVVVGETAYVASSQNHRIAVLNLTTRTVEDYIDLPGEDPRTLSVTPDGQFLVVANFLAGNRTESDITLNSHIFVPQGLPGAVCAPLLDGTGANIIDETHADFMDTSHPDYPLLAECYLFAETFGTSSEVVVNPLKPDHDLVVIRLADRQVVFTTDVLPTDIGTLNYGLYQAPSNGLLYVASTHARNDLDAGFGNRPLFNRLAILDLNPQSGALTLQSIVDLDAPFLDDEGLGAAIAATPYALTVAGPRLLVAAAGSDRLVLTDLAGNVTGSVEVGFTPKGVVADGNTAYVYNSTGLSVSRVDLDAAQQTASASIGPNAMSQSERIGAHLMNSAQFAINRTFSCASCHPDGHTDALVWMLNEEDGLRTSMTVQEISEFAPFHWDGSKCNLAKILLDGITFLFQDADGPTPCEMRTMIDFMNGMVRPHTPHRLPDDRFTEEAKLGLGLIHRANFKNLDDQLLDCSGREPDPAIEHKLLAAIGDPYADDHVFDGGAGPIGGTSSTETCSRSGCHVSPHWAHQGGQFEAVSIHGMWDRPITQHNGRPMRAKFLEALDVNRAYHGAPSLDAAGHVTGKAAAHAFNDGHFRHPELNFDGNPSSNAFTLTDAMTRFTLEEEHFQTGAVGITVVLDVANRNDTDVATRLALLESAASQGKVAYLGVGLVGGLLQSLSWDPTSGRFDSDAGGTYTLEELKQALVAGDSVMLHGALLPGQKSLAHPKVKAVRRATSPLLCSEGYSTYHATLETSETNAPLTIHAIDVVAGSRVMIDGQVTGAPLAGPGPTFGWVMPQAPSEPSLLALQLLSPTGLQSNSLSLPVVAPVVPAVEPDDLRGSKRLQTNLGLEWKDQFGVTGPGTRYALFRGPIEGLAAEGLTTGRCLQWKMIEAEGGDNEVPQPGQGFYYVVRAEGQVNVSSFGSPMRDAEAAAAIFPCPVVFP